jgi:cytidyltransferase-like protein
LGRVLEGIRRQDVGGNRSGDLRIVEAGVCSSGSQRIASLRLKLTTMVAKNMTKVLIFGTFDRLNAGHVSFLERAGRFADELIVLIVEDKFVSKYKGKSPVWSLKMRMSAVSRLPFKAKVYPEDIGENWKSLKTIKPDVIVLSAEQATWRHRLAALLKEYTLPTRVEVLPEIELGSDATSKSCANLPKSRRSECNIASFSTWKT